jgi:hypothetical protein
VDTCVNKFETCGVKPLISSWSDNSQAQQFAPPYCSCLCDEITTFECVGAGGVGPTPSPTATPLEGSCASNDITTSRDCLDACGDLSGKYVADGVPGCVCFVFNEESSGWDQQLVCPVVEGLGWNDYSCNSMDIVGNERCALQCKEVSTTARPYDGGSIQIGEGEEPRCYCFHNDAEQPTAGTWDLFCDGANALGFLKSCTEDADTVVVGAMTNKYDRLVRTKEKYSLVQVAID